jgi:3-dehydroquinate synthase
MRLTCKFSVLSYDSLAPKKMQAPRLRYDEANVRTIPVKTASAEYSVIVGNNILPSLYRRLAPYVGTSGRRVFVITSPQIWSLWSNSFLASFPVDTQPTVLFQPPGEQWKRFAQVERLITEMISAGADRSSLLIAFGGGIVGDVGGFVAASLMRGIDYIQMPSTLLSQVDSSVGGKVGVNLATGKNLAGAFHHPKAVFADIELLQTLPDRELRAGLFESIKAGIIRDAKLFRFMETQRDSILSRHAKALEQVIAASIRMKAEVVGIDERESGLRMILNLGHTVGHAIEAATHYRKLLHGEAVAWGMLAALEIGRARGTVTTAQAERIEQLIFAYGPLPPLKVKAAAIVEATRRDKKNRAGVRRFILPAGIGNSVVVENVTDTELNSSVAHMLTLVRARR